MIIEILMKHSHSCSLTHELYLYCIFIGKLVLCVVTGIARKRPQGDQLDEANPVRNEETGLWQCPFCQKKDFPELSEVSTCHFRLIFPSLQLT